jgi:hypothetical protein
MHGYHVDPIQLDKELDVTGRKDSPFKRAEEVVTKLREAQEMA